MTDKPMREPTFLVLTALAGEPRHGYAVIEDVASLTGGRVRLRAGTLYAALDRLRVEGLIEVDREEIVQSRLRRYYHLTATGERALATESERLRRQAAIAQQRLNTRRATFGTDGTAFGGPNLTVPGVRLADPGAPQAPGAGRGTPRTPGTTIGQTPFGAGRGTLGTGTPAFGRTVFGGANA